MLLKKELSQAVANLINNGLTPTPLINQPQEIKSEDVYPSLRMFFTDEAAKVLHNRIHTMIHQRNEVHGHEELVRILSKLNIKISQETKSKHGIVRVIDLVNFIGLSSSEHQLSEAVSKVISTINDLASRGFITAAMAPLSIIELHPSAGEDNRFIVVSYVAINSTGQIWVDNNLQQIIFKECSVPTNIKDIK